MPSTTTMVFAARVAETPQPFFQVGRVVVPEANDLGAAQPAAVVDAGVGVRVDQQHVAGAGQGCDHAQVGHVAGGKNDHAAVSEELRQFPFELHVPAVIAVGGPRPGGAGAFRAQRLAGGLDALRMERESQVVVGPGQDGPAAVDDRLGGGDHLLHHHVDRAHAAFSDRPARFRDLLKLVEYGHDYLFPIMC